MIIMIIKASRHMSKGLYVLLLSFFCQQTSNLPDVRAAPAKVYHWLGQKSRTKNALQHFANPPLIFTGEGQKSAKFRLDFFLPQSPLKHSGVEMEQHIGNLHISLERWWLAYFLSPPLPITGKNCDIWPKFGLWGSLVPKRATYLKPEQTYGAPMMVLSSPNLS